MFVSLFPGFYNCFNSFIYEVHIIWHSESVLLFIIIVFGTYKPIISIDVDGLWNKIE